LDEEDANLEKFVNVLCGRANRNEVPRKLSDDIVAKKIMNTAGKGTMIFGCWFGSCTQLAGLGHESLD
jgi:hypothetical protein